MGMPSMPEKNTVKQVRRIRHILALGNPAADGHLRLTRSEQFDVLLGDESTHAQLQHVCLALESSLKKSGRRLEDLSEEEFLALMRDCSTKKPGPQSTTE